MIQTAPSLYKITPNSKIQLCVDVCRFVQRPSPAEFHSFRHLKGKLANFSVFFLDQNYIFYTYSFGKLYKTLLFFSGTCKPSFF